MRHTPIHLLFVLTLILCAAMFLTCLPTAAQPVNIPDANLRAKVNAHLGKAPNAEITRAEMETLEWLIAKYANIRNLEGLQFATNLYYLSLWDNEVSDLSPLAGLTNIKTLSLSKNDISDLSPLAGMTKMQNLGLWRNAISDISPLVEMKWIYMIDLSDNEISDISPLAGLTNMEHLSLDYNAILDISPLAGMTRMKSLSLSNNVISDLSALAGLTNMEYLSLDYNAISDISPLEGMTQMKYLFLNDNEVSDISPLARMTKMGELYGSVSGVLDLSHNAISDLSSLAGMTNLGALDLSYNAISDLSPLAGLTEMKQLFLSGNEVSDISPLARMTRMGELVESDPGVLDLSNNAISDLSPLAGMTEMTKLRLSHNAISDISPLAGMTQMRELRLNDNKVSDISPLAGMTRMGELSGSVPGVLDLSHNAISDLSPLAGMTNLKTLYLSNNRISDFSPIMPLVTQQGFTLSDFGNLSNGNLSNPFASFSLAVRSAPNRAGVRVGDTFTLQLTAANLSDMAGWQTGITFDTNALEAIAVNEGDFLKSGGQDTSFSQGTLDNSAGTITQLSATRRSGGVTGAGVLLSVRFNAKSAGTKFIYLTDFQAVNSTGTRIAGTVNGIGFSIDAGQRFLAWDVNRDGQVSVLDLTFVSQSIGTNAEANYRADVNGDGSVIILDLVLVAQHLGESSTGAAPAPLTVEGSGLHPSTLQQWIDLAERADTGEPAFREGIANLEQLLTLFVPEKTVLFPNYPNPFNPETWLPYQLATPADVTIRIYGAEGQLVRTLALGYQAAGLYQYRSRAAYWDGKNGVGESVASGVYLYTLTAGDFTATRKMLILK